MANYRINYVLPMPKQQLSDASPFFGYTPGIISRFELVEKLLFLPQHVIEFLLDRDGSIAMRMSGGSYEIIPGELEILPHLPINHATPFWCLISSDDTAEAVSSFIRSCEHPVLHASVSDRTDAVPLTALDWTIILQHCHKVVAYLKTINAKEAVDFLRDLPRETKARKKSQLSLKRRHHFLTFANEVVLESNGYLFSGDEKLLAHSNNGPYVAAIRASANAVYDERLRVCKLRGLRWTTPFDLILTCPSFYSHVYTTKLPREQSYPLVRKLINSYRHQTHYFTSGQGIQIHDLQSEEAAVVIEQYRKEVRAYSGSVAVKAANHFAPVIRLPPAVNLVYPDLAMLGRCARAGTLHADRSLSKQERLFRRISEQLHKAVPMEYITDIDKPQSKLKLITNAPLEWLPIRGLPL
jgi:hypothetical protein